MPITSTAAELLRLQSQGASAESITREFLQSIRQRDPTIQAFLHVAEEGALEQARRIDAKRKRGEKLGPLAGIPIAIKDVLCVAGWPTTCGWMCGCSDT